jgi:hypothetical protein
MQTKYFIERMIRLILLLCIFHFRYSSTLTITDAFSQCQRNPLFGVTQWLCDPLNVIDTGAAGDANKILGQMQVYLSLC